MKDAKLNRAETVEKIWEIVVNATNHPADELIAMGKTMQQIGELLKGLDTPSAVATMQAVRSLLGK
jgi:hypothetical protein